MSILPRPKLKGLTKGMREELNASGIDLSCRYGLKVYDAKSEMLKKILQILSTHKLGDGGVNVFFRYVPGKEVRFWKVATTENPFRELTATVLDGLNYWRDDQQPCDTFALTQHLILPAKAAIDKVLRILQHPPSETCPIAYAFPPGTYLTHACFTFKKWGFAVRIFRE